METATPDPAPETPAKRRRGRPRSRPEEVRAVRLQVLVTEAEAADVRAVAEATGLSVSDFGRRRMLGKQTALLAEKIDRDATRSEINRVGVNLNQLLRRVHSGAGGTGNGGPGPSLAGALEGEIRAALQEVRAALDRVHGIVREPADSPSVSEP